MKTLLLDACEGMLVGGFVLLVCTPFAIALAQFDPVRQITTDDGKTIIVHTRRKAVSYDTFGGIGIRHVRKKDGELMSTNFVPTRFGLIGLERVGTKL